MSVAVIVVAAGTGERLGAGQPKALVSLRGQTILDWSVRAFLAHRDVDRLVVVAPDAACEAIAATLPAGSRVVSGGASRQESVQCGLAALTDDVDLVLVHDAARPLVPSAVITSVVAMLRSGADAVVPVLPVIDTIKRVDGAGRVQQTIERSLLRRVQTPQGFRLSVLRVAHQSSLSEVTDDAGLVEAMGGIVATVPGDEAAFKITTPYDLRLAELLVST